VPPRPDCSPTSAACWPAVPAVLKTMVFGCLVGLVGCWHGLRARRDGVVVASIFLVLVADVVPVKVIQVVTDLRLESGWLCWRVGVRASPSLRGP
jgi:hypothetical protein